MTHREPITSTPTPGRSAAPDTTPPPPYSKILTGHFREGRAYSTWRSRGTSDWLLIFTMSGGGRFGYRGGQLAVRSGDIVLIEPATRHDYGTDPAERKWELLWAHFQARSHWREWMEWPAASTGLRVLRLAGSPACAEVQEQLFRAHRYAVGGQPHGVDLAMNALEAALIWCSAANPRSELCRLDDRLRHAVQYVQQNLAQPLTVPAIAAASALSPSWLSRLFRDQIGVSPQEYLEQQRMQRAKDLLALTSHTISAIGAEVGYLNPFYFSARFKRYTGLSPRQYRRGVLSGAGEEQFRSASLSGEQS